MKILLLLAILSAASLAQSTKFEDVHVWVSKNPAQEGSRRDGILNFVHDAKALVTVINAEDEVVQVIPYSSISRIDYNPKEGKEIRVYFRNPDGVDRQARMKLHGGNWDEILQAFNKAGLTLNTVTK